MTRFAPKDRPHDAYEFDRAYWWRNVIYVQGHKMNGSQRIGIDVPMREVIAVEPEWFPGTEGTHFAGLPLGSPER